MRYNMPAMRKQAAHVVAIAGALLGIAALALQFVVLYRNLSAEGFGALAVIWRFLAFFTILTNVLITAMLARAALRPSNRSGLNSPRAEAIGVSGIALVGVVYHLLLANRWEPEGAQLVADIALHTAMPLMFIVFWLLRPHGALRWRDGLICMVWPLGYCAYALARGAFDGFYAYWFLDPLNASLVQMAFNVAAISGGFFAGALVFVAIDRALGART